MFTENHIKYAAEKTTALFQGKSITLTHLTPTFSPEEREKRKREIEGQLYGIFKKYAANETKP
jgi:hypothetical protein